MPELELRLVESGLRSSLYCSVRGDLYRFYHDNNRWDGPIFHTVDEAGVHRHSQNRRVSDLVNVAWKGGSVKPPAPYLRSALWNLTMLPLDIDSFASMCGVKTSTAWSYAGKVVEVWPLSHRLASRLVHPPLLKVCRETELAGTLTDLSSRLHPLLSGDVEWRCLEDRLSHLRLARICVEAERIVT